MDRTLDGWSTMISCANENNINTGIAAEDDNLNFRQFSNLWLDLSDSTRRMLDSPNCPNNIQFMNAEDPAVRPMADQEEPQV